MPHNQIDPFDALTLTLTRLDALLAGVYLLAADRSDTDTVFEQISPLLSLGREITQQAQDLAIQVAHQRLKK